MQRKPFGIIIGCVSLIIILMLSLNVMAAYDKSSGGSDLFNTDKTDRMLLKEIIINQQKTHALLQEIKSSLQQMKK